MITQITTHLLHLFACSHHDRGLLLAWYNAEQPGMPRGYIPHLVRWLIRSYPQDMQHCLRLLRHHSSAVRLLNVCP